MKKNSSLLFVLLICFAYFFLPGCSPGSIVLKDDASLKKLNEMVKDRRVRIATVVSVYEGENILFTRDSTTLKYLTTKPKVVNFSNIKEFHFDSGSITDGTIELKDNQIFKVRNIIISNLDSIVRFDAMIPGPFVFPTKDITKIQRWGHVNSVFSGMVYGLISGALLGAVVGTVISAGTGSGSNSGTHHWEDLGTFISLGTIAVGSLGLVVGAGIGRVVGQWEDIDITYSFEHKTP